MGWIRGHDLGGHRQDYYEPDAVAEVPRELTPEEIKAAAFQAQLAKMPLLVNLLASIGNKK
jgi:hypothetical protein